MALDINLFNRLSDPKRFTLMAGPCSIESEEQLMEIALGVKSEGASVLRGGIYKMRTHPESFQGLGFEAFALVKEAKKRSQLSFISEITDPRQIGDLYDLVDIFQVGSRNMYNYALLKELGRVDKPILLKRGFSALISEWIQAAQYIEKSGNHRVLLCERGIRSFDSTTTRNTLDLNAVAYLKKNTHYPVIVDPSHAVGVRDLISPMALASAVAGADGLLIEVHNHPEKALSDGFQALTLAQFSQFVGELKKYLPLLGRTLLEV